MSGNSRSTFSSEQIEGELATISEDRGAASVDPLSRWLVQPPGGREIDEYWVDPHQLAYGWDKKRPITTLVHGIYKPRGGKNVDDVRVGDQSELVRWMRPAIAAQIADKHIRTAHEFLTTFRHFLKFVDQMEVLERRSWSVGDLGELCGLKFADWLRARKMSSSRRSGIYSAARMVVREASGVQHWRSNPFVQVNDVDDIDRIEYTEENVAALLRMCVEIVESFRRVRRASLALARVGRRFNPTLNLKVNQVPKGMYPAIKAARTVVEIRERFKNGLNTSEMYAPQLMGILPTEEVVAAAFLLCMLRTGVNEQPLLDLDRNNWNKTNPFSSSMRNLVLSKNRVGGYTLGRQNPKRIVVPIHAWRKTYPVRVVRLVQLLTQPVIRSLEIEIRKGEASAATKRAEGKLWLFMGTNRRWNVLKAPHVGRIVTRMIGKRAGQSAGLRDLNGNVLRYSATAIRDAYLKFVLHQSNHDIEVGQMELGHSPDSPAIRNYLRRPWVRKYAKEQHLEYQKAVISAVASDQIVSPESVRKELRQKSPEKKPEFTNLDKVRHGLFCRDQTSPPLHIYKPNGDGDVCPALQCHDCPWANCFRSSLPSIAKDIDSLKRVRDTSDATLWTGSEAEAKLEALQDVFGRYSQADRDWAMKETAKIDTPNLYYLPSVVRQP